MSVVSIIMPTHNASEYLCRSINSIIAQTYKDWELIIVDDGSTDKTQLLIKELFSDIQNIHYYYKINGGAASARNYGLTKASPLSEFIVFCDSDDSIEPNYLQLLIENSRYADCTLCCIRNLYKDGSNNIINYNTKIEDFSDIWHNINFIKSFKFGLYNSSCNKIYKAKIIRKNLINFDTNIYNEDIDFNIQYLTHCKTVRYIPEPLYNYHHRDGSITSTPPERALRDYISLHLKLLANFSGNFQKYVDDFISYQYVAIILKLLKANKNSIVRKYLKLPIVRRSLKHHINTSQVEALQFFLLRAGFLNLYKFIFFK